MAIIEEFKTRAMAQFDKMEKFGLAFTPPNEETYNRIVHMPLQAEALKTVCNNLQILLDNRSQHNSKQKLEWGSLFSHPMF